VPHYSARGALGQLERLPNVSAEQMGGLLKRILDAQPTSTGQGPGRVTADERAPNASAWITRPVESIKHGGGITADCGDTEPVRVVREIKKATAKSGGESTGLPKGHPRLGRQFMIKGGAIRLTRSTIPLTLLRSTFARPPECIPILDNDATNVRSTTSGQSADSPNTVRARSRCIPPPATHRVRPRRAFRRGRSASP
jgi:hypothetical protein